MILKVLKPYLVVLNLIGKGGAILARFPKDFYAENDTIAQKDAINIRNRVRKRKFSNDSRIRVEIDKVYQVREI